MTKIVASSYLENVVIVNLSSFEGSGSAKRREKAQISCVTNGSFMAKVPLTASGRVKSV